MRLIFATNNVHKLKEVQQIFSSQIEIVSLKDVGFFDDIEETGSTLDENAIIKARAVYAATGSDCFADDTGLEVEALDGRPGVFSARYAGDGHNFEANIDKLLGELYGSENRKARFRTVVCLILSGKEHLFEGVVDGEILLSRQGVGGFGYDAVFQPSEENISFAEMAPDAKNKISHRGRVMKSVKSFLDLQ
ncbi:MAG: non-canonical purine NTP pyrophosphatase, RdgB/HAM1 family [Bacteroidetes bacterium HGW-Bacteroidetes-6]|jgi:XTP/dITP diphosphohydrolase|nr:MAG: non-canonical purine NTP pyrophosphatase, RdgB/HAM1 family [Bacteroidetes bacterium HGW-Bacteroidetes-6]